jgi:hypothetical protein
LLFQPLERLCPHRTKRLTESVFIATFIGRLIVANDHTIGVTAAHICVGVIHGKPVFAEGNRRFVVRSFTGDIVFDLKEIAIGVSQCQTDYVLAVFGKADGFCLFQERNDF